MSIPLRVGLLLLLLAVAALAGCERTAFQSPPSDSTRCDKALVGHWISTGDAGEQRGELEAFVGADCALRVEEQKSDGTKRSATTALHSDRVGSERYLWLDADWAHRSFEIDRGPLDVPGDVYVFSYATTGRDRLTLFNVRHRALAHRVLDKDVPGEVLARENALTVRIPGDSAAVAALLRKYRLFDLQNGIEFSRDVSGEPKR